MKIAGAAAALVLALGAMGATSATQPEAASDVRERENREAVMRRWFGDAFEPLGEPPPSVASGDEVEPLLKLAAGACDDGGEANEFALKECQDRVAAYKRGEVAIPPLVVMNVGEGPRYDFKAQAFRVAFTDNFTGSKEFSLSVWKPRLGRWWSDSTYRNLEHLILMPAAEAKVWKTTLEADPDHTRSMAWVRAVISVKPKSNWSKRFTTKLSDGSTATAVAGGVLVKVHALRIVVGDYMWSYPADWPSDWL